MAGSVRKSESLWNSKEETPPPGEMSGKNRWSGREHNSSLRRGGSPMWSNPEPGNELKSRDFSRRPSWEPLQVNSNISKDDDISRDRRRLHTDSASDGWGRQYSDRLSDNSFSLPHRGRGRGNIRSTSRDRKQSRSRSRSRSRDRGRVMARSRSRSRDRDRDRGRGKGGGSARGRSRSPFGDDRRESFEIIDSRGGPRISSQPCRNFATGNCRKGSQCRFSHHEDLNSRGGSHPDNDLTERWNSRPENPGASRYGDVRNSADRARNKVSDGYKRYSDADEQARDISKETSICKDFQRGRCNRGASCRFPHHVGASDNYDRGNENAYDDQDRKRQPNRNGKLPCKYFASGRCNRDDCKFSHDDATSGDFDGRSRGNSSGHNLNDTNKAWSGPSWDEGDASGFSDLAKSNHNLIDKNKSWNGPSWDDSNASGLSDVKRFDMDGRNKSLNAPSWDDSNTQGLSETARPNDKLDGNNKSWNGSSWDDSSASDLSGVAKTTGWDGNTAGNLKIRDFAETEKETYTKSRQWFVPGWNEKASDRNGNLSALPVSVTNDSDMATNELGCADREKPLLISGTSQSQTMDGSSSFPHQQYITPKDSGCQPGTTAIRPELYEISYNQQDMRQEGENLARIDDSNPLDVDMVSENAGDEVLSLGKGYLQVANNNVSQCPNLGGNNHFPLNPLNRPNVEVNGLVGANLPLHSLTQMKNHYSAAGEPREESEMKVPLAMPVMHERQVVTQASNLPPSLTQISQIGQLPQGYQINIANVIELVNSLPSTANSMLHIVPSFVQSNPEDRPGEQGSISSDVEASKPGNNGVHMGFLSSSTGQENQMQAQQLSPISAVDPKSSALQTSVSEKYKSPKIKQQETINLNVNENNASEKQKNEEESIHPGGSDAQAKEEGNISNDEKAMRQFKIALVELVKEILKPTWKEGRMSREVHKTIVKKVVDKVTSTVQGNQIPRTQEKIDQYLAFSKSKITKLVEAYVGRFLKA